MISDIDNSYKNYNPTFNYLDGTNPDGDPRLGSTIVFLNGHGWNDGMSFSQDSKGKEYMVGIINGDEGVSSKTGINYCSIRNRDLSNTKLIAFVGCETAEKSGGNIAYQAYVEGAEVSIGFVESIHSRNTYGPEWLKAFNDYIADGQTVKKAVNYATTLYPSSDLGSDIKMYGNPSYPSFSLADDTNYSIPFDGSCGRIVNAELNQYMDDFEVIVEEIKKIDNDFNVDEYKVTCNMYSEDTSSGIIIFTYYIGDEIATNKAYVASVENGYVTDIKLSLDELEAEEANVRSLCVDELEAEEANVRSLSDERVNELELIEKVNVFKETIPLELSMYDDNVTKETMYHYDFTTNELVYYVSTFTETPELDNAIVEETNKIIIN